MCTNIKCLSPLEWLTKGSHLGITLLPLAAMLVCDLKEHSKEYISSKRKEKAELFLAIILYICIFL